MTDLFNITKTDEGANYLPPFAVPMVRTVADCSPEIQRDVAIGSLCDWIWQLGVNRDRQLAREEAETETPFAAQITHGVPPVKTDIAPSAPREPLGRDKQGQNQAAVSTVTKVRWHWNETLAIHEGYDLWMGKAWIPFTLPEWRLEQAINPPLKSKAEHQDVNWTVTWNRPNGRPSIIDLAIAANAKENEMENVKDAIDKEFQRVQATRAETEFDTFDKPAEETPVLPWGDQNDERGRFFARYENEVWGPRKCSKEQSEVIRKQVLHHEYGTDTLKGFNGDVTLLLAKLTSAVEAEYPLAMVYLDEQAAKDKPVTEQLTVATPDAPQSNGKADALNDTLPSGVIANELPEAPFSANFYLYHKRGVNVQFTVRTDTVSEGIRRVDMTIDNLLAKGYTVERPGQVTAASAPTTVPQTPTVPTTPTISEATGGTVRAVEVKRVQDEGETHYQLFSQAGADTPAFTLRIDADHKKLLATGLAIDQLTVGTRYPWPVDVDWAPGKINPRYNRPYRNVTAIRKAA